MAMVPSFVSPPKGDLVQLLRLGRFLTPYRWRVVAALLGLVVAAIASWLTNFLAQHPELI